MSREISKGKNSKKSVVILIIICALVIGVVLILFIGNLESPKMENKYMKVAFTEDENIYDENGNLSGREKYERNCDANVITYEEYNLDDELEFKREYEYDDQGNMISIKVTSSCYDANGKREGMIAEKKNCDDQLLSIEGYNLDNELEYKVEHEYNDQGNEVSYKCYYDGQGEPDEWTETVFDAMGNELYKIDRIATEEYGSLEVEEEIDDSNVPIDVTIVTEVKYNADGSVLQIIESTYAEKEQLLEKIEYDNEGNITFWVECTYNKRGNLLERIEYDTNGQVYFMEEFTYDKDGNVIERIEYDGEGDIILHAKLSKENVAYALTEEGVEGIVHSNGPRKALVYDGKGNVIGWVHSNGGYHWDEYIDGELQNWYRKGTYMGKNGIFGGTDIDEGRNGKAINFIKKLYDEQDKLTDVYVLADESDGIVEGYGVHKWIWYMYDAQNRIAQVGEKVNLNGDALRLWNYYYDNQDRVVKMEDEKQGSVKRFTYNEQGDLLKEVEYSKNQEIVSLKEYKYEKR